MPEKRVRITLDLSQLINQRLEDISRRRGLTKADILRASVNLLFAAKRAMDEGFTVGAWGDRIMPCCGQKIRIEREFAGS